MINIYEKAREAAAFLHSKGIDKAAIAIVTGSGISEIIRDYEVRVRIPFGTIPHLVKSTFHKGELLFCNYQGTPFIVLNGRLHYYEGYSAQEITFPVRVLKEIGIRTLLLTNASGGLNPTYKAGQLVLIRDHINLMPEHPLRGPNDDRLGDRFPDMSNAYDINLQKKILHYAKEEGIELSDGVYVGFQGPSLETTAEYKFLHIIGGDMVGMSTVPEAIVANHCNMQVAGISVVTNLCYPPDKVKKTTVEDVINTANAAVPQLSKIINKLILNS